MWSSRAVLYLKATELGKPGIEYRGPPRVWGRNLGTKVPQCGLGTEPRLESGDGDEVPKAENKCARGLYRNTRKKIRNKQISVYYIASLFVSGKIYLRQRGGHAPMSFLRIRSWSSRLGSISTSTTISN